jgi:hypothetical protein
MKRHRVSALAGVVVMLCSQVCLADENRRDGNVWRTMDQPAKTNYMVGFLDGMDLGHSYSIAQLLLKPSTKSCVKPASDSYQDLVKTYMNNVTVGQIVEGLDTFYSDYRNRSIRIYNAVMVVVMPFGGVSKEVIESYTEHLRASDNQQ